MGYTAEIPGQPTHNEETPKHSITSNRNPFELQFLGHTYLVVLGLQLRYLALQLFTISAGGPTTFELQPYCQGHKKSNMDVCAWFLGKLNVKCESGNTVDDVHAALMRPLVGHALPLASWSISDCPYPYKLIRDTRLSAASWKRSCLKVVGSEASD